MATPRHATTFTALYATPLLYRTDVDTVRAVQHLDLERERSAIFSVLSQANRQIHYLTGIATVAALRDSATVGTGALHISGHGDDDGLAFDTGKGFVLKLSADVLRQLLSAGGGTQVQFVFVSACKSIPCGQSFVDAGVRHVLASERNLSDDSAIVFARSFYLALFVGRTIQQSFDVAVASLSAENPEIDVGGFRLLPEGAAHDISIYEGVSEGPFIDLSPPSPPNYGCYGSRPIVGRNCELQVILEMVIGGERVIVIKGERGIGKTELALNCGRHFNFRRVFADGVCLISCTDLLKGSTDWGAGVVEKLFELLRRASLASFELSDATSSSEGGLLSSLRKRNFLLILDEFDAVPPGAAMALCALLFRMLQTCPRIFLLITSTVSPEGSLCSEGDKSVILPPLSSYHATLLFLQRGARKLTYEEMGAVKGTHTVTEAVKILSNHPLLEMLAGHPRSICEAASLLQEFTLDELLLQAPEIRSKALRTPSPPHAKTPVPLIVDDGGREIWESLPDQRWTTFTTTLRQWVGEQVHKKMMECTTTKQCRSISNSDLLAIRRFYITLSFSPGSQSRLTPPMLRRGVTEGRGAVRDAMSNPSSMRRLPIAGGPLLERTASFAPPVVPAPDRHTLTEEGFEKLWKWLSPLLRTILCIAPVYCRVNATSEPIHDVLKCLLDDSNGASSFLLSLTVSDRVPSIAGFITRAETELVLAKAPGGSFLFRFSERHPGMLAVGVVKPQGGVLHSLIGITTAGVELVRKEVLWCADAPSQKEQPPFSSLIDFVLQCELLTQLHPGIPKEEAFPRDLIRAEMHSRSMTLGAF